MLAQLLFHAATEDADVLDLVVVTPVGLLGRDYEAGSPLSFTLHHGSTECTDMDGVVATLGTWATEMALLDFEIDRGVDPRFLTVSDMHGEELVLALSL